MKRLTFIILLILLLLAHKNVFAIEYNEKTIFTYFKQLSAELKQISSDLALIARSQPSQIEFVCNTLLITKTFKSASRTATNQALIAAMAAIGSKNATSEISSDMYKMMIVSLKTSKHYITWDLKDIRIIYRGLNNKAALNLADKGKEKIFSLLQLIDKTIQFYENK